MQQTVNTPTEPARKSRAVGVGKRTRSAKLWCDAVRDHKDIVLPAPKARHMIEPWSCHFLGRDTRLIGNTRSTRCFSFLTIAVASYVHETLYIYITAPSRFVTHPFPHECTDLRVAVAAGASYIFLHVYFKCRRPSRPLTHVCPSSYVMKGGVCVFFMASALWVCSGPVISPLLGVLLGKSSGFAVGGSGTGSAHVMAFCGVILGIYVLTMVSKHFPDSRTVSGTCVCVLRGSK